MESLKDWWKPFFLEGWQQVQNEPKTAAHTFEECDFLEGVTGRAGPLQMLDVPCGNGRIAVELAARGHAVTGVDFNSSMIENAQQRAQQRETEVTWHITDMRDMPYAEHFDLVACIYGSFGYFDQKGDRAFVQAVAKALKKGGLFVLDVHVMETLLPVFQAKGFERFGEKVIVLQERQFNPAEGRIEVLWTLIKDHDASQHYSTIRLYSYRELTALLADHGFYRFKAFGSFKGEPFRFPGASRLVLVAEKR